MTNLLNFLSDFIYKHAKLTIILVLTILGIIGGLSIHQGARFSEGSLKINGTESQNGLNIVKKDFNSVASNGATEKVVFRAHHGKLTDPAKSQAIKKFAKEISEDSTVQTVALPSQLQNLTKKQTIGYATVIYKNKKADIKQKSIDHLVHATKGTKNSGIQTELTGDLTINKLDTGERSEVFGILAAIIILAITFSSLMIAGLPIISALIGLAISISGIIISSHFLTFVTADLSLSGMIGLAVGIDYSLFIISRYRQEIARGLSRQRALSQSMTTAGQSVIFAGITVIVALLAMKILNIEFLTVMGLAGGLSVLTALLTSLTFVPASIVLLGSHATGEKRNPLFNIFWHFKKDYGWGRFISKFKIPLVLGTIGLLLLTAIPFAHINLGLPDDGSKSTKLTERRAFDLMEEGYGAGNSATLVVLVKTQSPAKALATYHKISTDANVASLTKPMPGNRKSGHYYMISVTPKTDGNDVKTKKLVTKIRSQSQNNRLPKLLVTGSTAINIDMSTSLLNALPKFATLIVTFAFILLLLVFRSLLIPFVAVGGFVLSLLATLGSLVFIVQDGHFMNLIGLTDESAVLNFLPVLVIGILFGLAMDYEVFLVSRIREVYDKTGNSKQAVLEGLKASGTAVFAAALIMTAVFMGFVFAGDSTVKSMGLALSLGIFFDTFIVRMVLIPSAISLFGEANWYLPKWLSKVLPHAKVK